VNCELIDHNSIIDAGFPNPLSFYRALRRMLSLSRSKVSLVRSSRSLAASTERREKIRTTSGNSTHSLRHTHHLSLRHTAAGCWLLAPVLPALGVKTGRSPLSRLYLALKPLEAGSNLTIPFDDDQRYGIAFLVISLSRVHHSLLLAARAIDCSFVFAPVAGGYGLRRIGRRPQATTAPTDRPLLPANRERGRDNEQLHSRAPTLDCGKKSLFRPRRKRRR
jgi:hypothetical protein